MDATIARNIVRDRESVDLTQKQFAESAGMRVEVLNRIERGVNQPSLRTLKKIEKGLLKTGLKRK